jgi:hypothetical protein
MSSLKTVLPLIALGVITLCMFRADTWGSNLRALYFTWSPYHYAYVFAGFTPAASVMYTVAMINIHHFIVDGFIWRLKKTDANRGIVDWAAPIPAQAQGRRKRKLLLTRRGNPCYDARSVIPLQRVSDETSNSLLRPDSRLNSVGDGVCQTGVRYRRNI